MTNKDLANLIFPNITKTPDDYEKKYPKRNLKEGAYVSRFAPSPTGFVHFGGLFTSFVTQKIVKDSDGVFFLRIEDTDTERSIDNGITSIVKDLKDYQVEFDEGVTVDLQEKGNYGPYIQSERKEIYQTYAKYLIEQGLAYPCFCTKEELDEIRALEEHKKEHIGYYGRYARYRTLPVDEAITKIKNGEPYIIRFKSPGNYDKKIVIKDLIRGKLEFPENDLDVVIIKKDGLPTYHFAHAIDDHLMRTNLVVRGDEWVSSLPLHVQLFETLGFEVPKYAHLSPLMKIDENGSKRKLSKRKDPEAAVSFYHEQGIPVEAVILYILTVANSNFEAWLEQNPNPDLSNFKFDFKKVSSSGSLFDMDKLLNISKNYLSHLKAFELYNRVLNYADEFDLEFKELLDKYKDYSINVLNIEREQKKPRKDYESYNSVKKQIWYMYDELFNEEDITYEFVKIQDKEEINKILKLYFDEYFDASDDKETWFNKMKEMTEKLGYCANIKEYKQNPDLYKGNITDITTVIRVVVTSKNQTPDLYEILRLLGKDRIEKRIDKFNCQ